MTEDQTVETETLIGVISDTHGLLRPAAIDALQGVDRIINAGDVGETAILDALRDIAPLTAVHGNIDRGEVRASLPATEVAQCGEIDVYVLHDLYELDLDPAAADFDVVISGHTHRPLTEYRGGVLYLNPGSAGPRRYELQVPVTVALLRITGKQTNVEMVELQV